MTEYSTIQKSTTIAAAPTAILPRLTDFHRWVEWSPWEGLDPALERSYTGADNAVGAEYAWNGNRKAGAGTMRLEEVRDDSVNIALTFTRPFSSASRVRFNLTPSAAGTEVVWTMESPKTIGSRIFGLIMNMEKMIGSDLDKGLASLKRVVEGAA
ncbi:SRPBCC family protein [Galbitalea soli]|uniref:SRPBCC family protein n=1 Tax=Galbitalea soli TaxID=1268042 RepID=A0A7C9PMQ1_9MICO|nr:SRPBCC family protein [Galbitalea soli]NEM90967.1 SRPBCC family protein [Galbitalea soli]NYJ29654.1 hypothetical protein [Galbitalea soli]